MTKNFDSMDGHQFEDLIDRLLNKMGFVTLTRKKTADGGIDIYAINEKPIIKGKYIIQCKRYSKNVDVSIIRDLFGVVTAEKANKGILITNSKFTQQTKDFARDKPLELIDGQHLANLLDEYLGNSPNLEIPVEIPESYIVTVEVLKPTIDKICKRVDKVKKGIVYLNRKQLESDKYFDFIQLKFSKLSNVLTILTNQFNYLNDTWAESIQKNEEYSALREVKSHTIDIVKGLEIIESDWEEIFSVDPPDNMVESNSVLCEIYEYFLQESATFINALENELEKAKGASSIDDIHIGINLVFEIPEELSRKHTNAMKRAQIAIYEDIEALKQKIEEQKVMKSSSGCFLPILYSLLLILLAVN